MNTRVVLMLCAALVFGVFVIAGLTSVFGTAEEEIRITDSWLVKGRQVDVRP